MFDQQEIKNKIATTQEKIKGVAHQVSEYKKAMKQINWNSYNTNTTTTKETELIFPRTCKLKWR